MEDLTNATKGSIIVRDNLLPDVDLSDPATPLDLGSASKRFGDLYMSGEGIGFRAQNVADFASLPAPSALNKGRLAWVDSEDKIYVDDGGVWVAGVSTLVPTIPKNLLINGSFLFWQRATSFTVTTTSGYRAADRFYVKAVGSSASFAFSRSTDTPSSNKFKYSARMLENGDATTNSMFIQQRIEAVDILPYIGEEVTVSAWTKRNLGVAKFNIRTPVSNTEDSWNADLQSDTIQSSSANFSLAPGIWVQETYTFTVPAAAVDGLSVEIEVGPYTGVADFFTTGWVLNPGTTATDFTMAGNTVGDELSFCQRYYEKSYDLDEFPGDITTRGAVVTNSTIDATNTSADINNQCVYKVTKRAQPTFTMYSTITGASGQAAMFDETGLSRGDKGIVTVSIGHSSARSRINNLATNEAFGSFHFEAENEL